MLIDCHTHIADLQDLEEYAKSSNEDTFALTMLFPNFTPENKDRFYKNIDEMIAANQRIAVIAGIDVNSDIQKQLAEIKANIEKRRIVAMKIYLGYQPIFADDPRLNPVYKFAKEHKLTMVYHCGVVAHSERIGTFYKHSSEITRIDDVAVVHPEVNFVISHLAFPKLWDTAAIVMKNDNVYTCISGLFEGAGDFSAQAHQVTVDLNAIQIYWPELGTKVMYGTDFSGDDTPLKEVRAYKKIVKSTFDSNIQADVLYNNALRAYPRLKPFVQSCCEQ